MILAIARHEWRRLWTGMTFWLLLAVVQLVVAWLAFAQLEAFAAIAPQLQASAASLGAMDLVVAPTLNSLVLLLLLATPPLAMGSLAGETRSGRTALWFSAPLSSSQMVLGKLLGLWFATLPLLACGLLTIAALGLGIALDPARLGLAGALLLLLGLWLAAINLFLSGLFDHPAAALTASYGVLLFLWLLDSLSGSQAAWSWLALLPHVQPALQGLLRSQDIVYFIATGGAAILLSVYGIARRRGEVR